MPRARFFRFSLLEDTMRHFVAALAALTILVTSSAVLAAATGIVKGVTTLAGKPVGGVALTLQGEGATLRATSGGNGQFAFAIVPFGHYTLTAHRAGTPDITQDVDVQTDSVVNLALEMQPLQEIGKTAVSASTRTVGNAPVSVNSVTRDQIAALPQNESLDNLIETVPGIVHFSYNEPVAHGFHGLSYEIDGVPIPLGTASNFSEVIDPRTIDSLEVITGAFPAEYGGSRQGAVVNIVTDRFLSDLQGEHGTLTLGGGNYGEAESSLSETIGLPNTQIFFNLNEERTSRGLDSPTATPDHDNGNQSDQFLRTITKLSSQDTLAFNFAENFAGFQIPINTVATANDPLVVPAGTDDVQNEYDRTLSLAYTHNTKDGLGYFQVVPSYEYDRIAYLGDLPNDIMGYEVNPGAPNTPLDGLRQDRHSQFMGLRLTAFHSYGANAVKAGIDESIENFAGTELIDYYDVNNNLQAFSDNQAQRGTQTGAYIEDKWTPTPYFSIFAGERYDRSTGYVDGDQLSPRFEIDGQVDSQDILHFYYGRNYAAPFLEDTRRDAVVTAGGNPNALPVYDLQPERDQYYEFGLAHTFAPGARAYVNFWKRDASDVLDTTQIFPTPIFAVYNNTIGIAKGVEGRVDVRFANGDTAFTSMTLSQSFAGGISGGTFPFCPPPTTAGCLTGIEDVTLQPEDHDMTYTQTLDYTKRFGDKRAYFASFEPIYGTGYPVQFQNGSGRLPPHLTFDASIGREAKQKGQLGFVASWQNMTNYVYLLKVNNGFNTTQYAPGSQFSLRLIAPF
jgi:outer membrane receptor protein involved in Fe transport